jgi:hypothetical protein
LAMRSASSSCLVLVGSLGGGIIQPYIFHPVWQSPK